MQIERLIQMIFYIVNHRHVTAKELADYFHVSTRTVYRDINTLTLAGIPVLCTKGAGGGISLIDGYTIDHSVLSEEEQQSIYRGLQLLQAANYPDAETALHKISSVFRTALEPKWLDVDFSCWGSSETEQIKLSDLQYAILNRHRIRFLYYNTELKKSERTIEPLRLVFKSHAWYIIGYCMDRKQIRTFRLSRIKRLLVLPEIFERSLPPSDSPTPACSEECSLPCMKLKFSPEIAYRLCDEFSENQICLHEDGYYYVTVPYEPTHGPIHYLLSFGKYVEVIEPEPARMMLKEAAAAIVKLYTP